MMWKEQAGFTSVQDAAHGDTNHRFEQRRDR
jgi:hypothetical protein